MRQKKRNLACISLINATIQHAEKRLFEGLYFEIKAGEQWAILGASGTGKTSLLQVLAGKKPLQGGQFASAYTPTDTVLLTPKHHFKSRSNQSDFYYQQRYNSLDVEEALSLQAYYTSLESRGGYWTIQRITDQLDLTTLLDKPIIALSNGETRRAMLGAALLKNPKLLLLDDPFVGLDQQTYTTYSKHLKAILDADIQVVMTCKADEIPTGITHIASIHDRQLEKGRPQYIAPVPAAPVGCDQETTFHNWPVSPEAEPSFEYILRMQNVCVTYHGNLILDHIDWDIQPRARWVLLGHNGAGKSTLLSLINGDNPQAYANNIMLFDRKRGSGESIWDIKRKIGFVSPELHQYFPRDQTGFQVVCSGLFDTLGLYRKYTAAQATQVDQLMQLMEIGGLKTKLFSRMSLSEQRLCLLARAFIKKPPLFILDEPAQGLDEAQTMRIKTLVDAICTRTGAALIFVTHRMNEIPACVTHILELDHGKIKQNTAFQMTS